MENSHRDNSDAETCRVDENDLPPPGTIDENPLVAFRLVPRERQIRVGGLPIFTLSRKLIVGNVVKLIHSIRSVGWIANSRIVCGFVAFPDPSATDGSVCVEFGVIGGSHRVVAAQRCCLKEVQGLVYGSESNPMTLSEARELSWQNNLASTLAPPAPQSLWTGILLLFSLFDENDLNLRRKPRDLWFREKVMQLAFPRSMAHITNVNAEGIDGMGLDFVDRIVPKARKMWKLARGGGRNKRDGLWIPETVEQLAQLDSEGMRGRIRFIRSTGFYIDADQSKRAQEFQWLMDALIAFRMLYQSDSGDRWKRERSWVGTSLRYDAHRGVKIMDSATGKLLAGPVKDGKLTVSPLSEKDLIGGRVLQGKRKRANRKNIRKVAKQQRLVESNARGNTSKEMAPSGASGTLQSSGLASKRHSRTNCAATSMPQEADAETAATSTLRPSDDSQVERVTRSSNETTTSPHGMTGPRDNGLSTTGKDGAEKAGLEMSPRDHAGRGAESGIPVLPETSPEQPMAQPLTQFANNHTSFPDQSAREESCMETWAPPSATALELLREAGISIGGDSDDETRMVLRPLTIRGATEDEKSMHARLESRVADLEMALARSLVSRKEVRVQWTLLKGERDAINEEFTRTRFRVRELQEESDRYRDELITLRKRARELQEERDAYRDELVSLRK